ncbi:MAG: FAD-dependent oxidoreductase [Candidatus Rokubacteria bacterium]|nr:FAD-dependent oxidoreductase [Candidatus Rokubacteria bacterium]
MRPGPGAERVPVAFAGRTLFAIQGQSLAAFLASVGVLALRETATGADRGVFCGMGVCQDCLVVVDGVPNQRACMLKITRPVTVARQTATTAAADSHSLPPVSLDDYRTECPQILVIGGGAGGLASAVAARNTSAQVVLLDERGTLGGQYYKQMVVGRRGEALDAQQAEGRILVEAVARSGTTVVTECEVWGAFSTDGAAAEILAVEPAGTRRFRPARLIVATGAYERGLPVPGWTLPGVMTTGAAQTFWRSYRTLPGRRVLIAGNGPLNIQVACEFAKAGAAVVAVAESAGAPSLGSFRALAAMAAADPALVRAGVGYRAGLARYRVPLLYRHVVTRIVREGDGLAVTLTRLDGRVAGRGRCFHADVVCLGYGFQPSNEILRALGAKHDYDPARGQLVTRRTADGRTTVPGVYGVGDCCGLGGAKVSVEEGTLAGLAAARSLGLATPGAALAEADARRRLARARRFERALWSLFEAPRFEYELADGDTAVCRCEEVSFGQIEATLADGALSIGEVKQRTRAGMGRCQGRYCAPVIAALLADRQGRRVDELAFFAPRAPVKPVAVVDLARLVGPGDQR